MKSTTVLDPELYVPLSNAAEALIARKSLCSDTPSNALEERLGSSLYAVLFRQIATANFETLRFVSLARSAGLTPLVVEYHRDRFIEGNPTKHALVRMRFQSGIGRNGGPCVRCATLANLSRANGKPLGELRTKWGQGIIDVHHRLLSNYPALRGIEYFDASDWFCAHGGRAREYYPALFELFVRRAVLFESFPTEGYDAEFTSRVMLPAFDAAFRKRRERPLVCRLDPVDAESDPYWIQYPGELFDRALSLAGWRRSPIPPVTWLRRLGAPPQLLHLIQIRKTPSA